MKLLAFKNFLVCAPFLFPGDRQGRGYGWHYANLVLLEHMHYTGLWIQHDSSTSHGILFCYSIHLLRLILQLAELLLRVGHVLFVSLRENCGDYPLDSWIFVFAENPDAETRGRCFPFCLLLPLFDYVGAVWRQLSGAATTLV